MKKIILPLLILFTVLTGCENKKDSFITYKVFCHSCGVSYSDENGINVNIKVYSNWEYGFQGTPGQSIGFAAYNNDFGTLSGYIYTGKGTLKKESCKEDCSLIFSERIPE